MHCFQTTVGRRARGHLQDLRKKLLRRTHALAPGSLPPFRPPGPLCHSCLPVLTTSHSHTLSLFRDKVPPTMPRGPGGAPPLCLPHCSGKKMLPPVFVILPDIFSRMLRPRCGHERSCCGHGAGMDGHAAVTGGHARSCCGRGRSCCGHGRSCCGHGRS